MGDDPLSVSDDPTNFIQVVNEDFIYANIYPEKTYDGIKLCMERPLMAPVILDDFPKNTMGGENEKLIAYFFKETDDSIFGFQFGMFKYLL